MKIKRPKIGSRTRSLEHGPIERGFPEPESPKHNRNRTQKNVKTRRSKSRNRYKN